MAKNTASAAFAQILTRIADMYFGGESPETLKGEKKPTTHPILRFFSSLVGILFVLFLSTNLSDQLSKNGIWTVPDDGEIFMDWGQLLIVNQLVWFGVFSVLISLLISTSIKYGTPIRYFFAGAAVIGLASALTSLST